MPLRPRAMGRVFDNLLENARRHGRPPIRLECRRRGDCMRISVLDRGPGLATGDLSNAFHPFVRGQHVTSGGSGLGLSTARQIVRAHGGELTLHPRPAGGFEARIELPVPDQG